MLQKLLTVYRTGVKIHVGEVIILNNSAVLSKSGADVPAKTVPTSGKRKLVKTLFTGGCKGMGHVELEEVWWLLGCRA